MPIPRPARSYVVWHTQRTGSTLLCTTLERTGVAGRPDEWPEDFEKRLLGDSSNADAVRDDIWARQTSQNGVFGMKLGFHERVAESFFGVFSRAKQLDRKAAWESVFPNCRHIVMTRRNKLRLAVSWWKAIKGGPGHLSRDGAPLPWQGKTPSMPANLAAAYDFDAIKALVLECVRREAGIQELLTELGVAPLAVTYEDFVANYEGTVRGVLAHIGLADAVAEIPAPLLAKTSDDLNDEWVTRFVAELGT